MEADIALYEVLNMALYGGYVITFLAYRYKNEVKYYHYLKN
jgi:hypothetical protein